MNEISPDTATLKTPEKGRGCLFYGFITAFAVVALLGVGGALTFRKFAKMFNAAMLEYTDTTPAVLPKVDMSADEFARLQERVAAFGKALEAHTNTPPLVLTDREVNALLEKTPQAQDLKLEDHFFLAFKGDQINAQISLPMDQYNRIPFLHTKGRFFNGVATLGASFTNSATNSALSITIKSVEAKGKPLPAEFVAALQNYDDQYILNDVNNNPTNQPVLNGIGGIEIKDGSLVIKAKP